MTAHLAACVAFETLLLLEQCPLASLEKRLSVALSSRIDRQILRYAVHSVYRRKAKE
jgi:hypothetical protein